MNPVVFAVCLLASVVAAVSIAAAVILHVMLRVVDHHGGQWVPWLRIDEEAI